MNWYAIANDVFSLRIEVIVTAIALFAIPAIQVMTYVVPLRSRVFVLISSIGGRWECLTGWLRDWIGIPYLIGTIAWHTYHWIPLVSTYNGNIHFAMIIGAIALIALNEIARIIRKRNLMALVEWTRSNRAMMPSEFFGFYYAAHGPIRQQLPASPHTVIDPLHIDARTRSSKNKPTIWPTLRAVNALATIAKLIVLTDKFRGDKYARDAASNLGAIVSAKLVYLAQIEFSIEGIDKLRDLAWPTIYCFNHTSAFDFNLIPLFMLAHRDASGSDMPLVPTFMLARDHFLKNPILYHIIGIGRAAEIMGMVFVERNRSNRSTASQAVESAVNALLSSNAPLAIYPQGSRARPTFTADGARMDAGYYTVGSLRRLSRDGGHIKKGAAFVATDAAMALWKNGNGEQVNIVPVVFIGAGSVLPKTSLKVQRGLQVKMRVGNPIIVTPEAIGSLTNEISDETRLPFVARLNTRIDNALKSEFRIHAELERRFFEDMRSMLDPLQIEELAIAMKQWRGEDYLVYATLDCIYACNPKHWRPMLGRLTHLILEDAPREDFLELKSRIAQHLI
jgi:1-acyl-sn-glycerol-3-phosphate acyltransferase